MDTAKDKSIAIALKKSSKGQLKYDTGGRGMGILDSLSTNLTSISSKYLPIPYVMLANSSEKEDKRSKTIDLETKDEMPQKCEITIKDKNSTHLSTTIDDEDDYDFVRQHNEKQLLILQYEEEQSRSCKMLYNSKQIEFERFTIQLEKTIEQQYQAARNKYMLDNLRKEAELHQIEQLIIRQNENEFKAKTANERFKEAEIKQQQIEKTLEREKERKLLFNQLQEYHQTFHLDLLPKIYANLTLCEECNFKDSLPQWIDQLTHFSSCLNHLTTKSNLETISNDDLSQASSLLEQSKNLNQDIVSALDVKRRTVLEDSKMHQSLLSATDISSQTISSTCEGLDSDSRSSAITRENQPTLPNIEEMEENVEEEKNDNYSKPSERTSLESVREYLNVVSNLKSYEESIQSFATNPGLKKYRFDLHKVVTMPINAISSCSGSHLKDKIFRLVSLLSGGSVKLNEKYVSCNKDPLAVNYCKNLIAKKLVMQGEEQVASQHSTAFPFAAAIVGLCSKHPDLWPLILGHFYIKCPYLVPFYPPREDNESDVDYKVKLGYKCVDSELEEKDHFLKRMSGFTRLYAAILQTDSPPGLPPAQIHSLERAWTWVARVLNMDPQPEVTATQLFDLLVTAGHKLDRIYGKQFRKMLYALCKEYYLDIKRATPVGSGGPVSRLEEFLQTVIKKGHIESPEGMLSLNFWRI